MRFVIVLLLVTFLWVVWLPLVGHWSRDFDDWLYRRERDSELLRYNVNCFRSLSSAGGVR